jgi:hypothetical protein
MEKSDLNVTLLRLLALGVAIGVGYFLGPLPLARQELEVEEDPEEEIRDAEFRVIR